MDSLPKSRRIRQYIRACLASLAGATLGSESETLLIRDGVYCGHRFRAGAYEAVWFVEEDQVKFFGPEGELIRSVGPGEMEHRDIPQAA